MRSWACFWPGAYLALTGKGLTAGAVILFVNLMNFMIEPVAELPALLAARSRAGLIAKLADALEQDEVQPDGVQIAPLMRQLRLEDVRFSYDGETEILRGVSAVFGCREGLRDCRRKRKRKIDASESPDDTRHGVCGKILLDGQNCAQSHRNPCMRRCRSFSRMCLFSMPPSATTLPCSAASRRRNWRRPYAVRSWKPCSQSAARTISAGKTAAASPGGEKQRISIARSLLKHASVLLADEATAALDAQTAHQVTDDVLSLSGVTRIVVTHTLEQAALRRYDGILVLKDGRIAESGSFDDLMAQKGYFYALYTVSQ